MNIAFGNIASGVIDADKTLEIYINTLFQNPAKVYKNYFSEMDMEALREKRKTSVATKNNLRNGVTLDSLKGKNNNMSEDKKEKTFGIYP